MSCQIHDGPVPPGAADGRRLDVCVVTYRSEAVVGPLLESLAAQLPMGARVLVVDNSPDSATVDAITASRPMHLDLEVVSRGHNVGFAVGCNLLAQHSDREWLLFLNPDTTLDEWPSGMFEHGPAVMLGPVISDPDGIHQKTFGHDRTLTYEFRQRLLRAAPPLEIAQAGRETDFVSGAAMLVNRERFNVLGGFDPRYFMYYEDIDLGRRWRLAGGQIRVISNWRVTHIGGASANADQYTALTRSFNSALAFHGRWRQHPRLFYAMCLVEALIKWGIALPIGRVGSVDARTQRRFLRYLLTGGAR